MGDKALIRKIFIAAIVGVALTLLFVAIHGLRQKEIEFALRKEFEVNHFRVALGEFLIRVHDEHLDKLEQILAEHGLALKMPLFQNWVLVAEDEKLFDHHMVHVEHDDAQSTLSRLQLLHADKRISMVGFNHQLSIANDDGWFNESISNDEPDSQVNLPTLYHANDPYFARQWNLQRLERAQLGAMDVEGAWRLTRGAPNVVVAVIEDGFFLNHPDLKGDARCQGRYLPGFDFTGMSRSLPGGAHGTNVLGILAACSNNRRGITGVNWNSRVLPVARGKTTSDTLLSVLWATGHDPCQNSRWRCPPHVKIPANSKPADVINMSFVVYPQKLQQKYHRYLVRDFWQEAMSVASQQNSIVVAAAGNESALLTPLHHAPGGAEAVIAVGSVDRKRVSPHNSRFGPDVDILAPGVSVWTTDGNDYGENKGTSFAAPAVSGIVSLMKSVYPDLNWKSARYFLQRTATPLTCDQYCASKSQYDQCQSICCDSSGNSICPGLANAAAAVQIAKDCAAGLSRSTCVKIGNRYLPNAPLIDLDKYVVFADSSTQASAVNLSNRGAAKAWIELRASDSNWMASSKKMVGNRVVLGGGESTRVVFSRKSNGKPVDSTITFEARADNSPFSMQKPPVDTVTTVIRYKL